jgi:hypothetical protein
MASNLIVGEEVRPIGTGHLPPSTDIVPTEGACGIPSVARDIPCRDSSRPSLKEVLLGVRRMEFRANANGDWPFDPEELIRDLVEGRKSLNDPILQATLLDWMESEDYNEFLDLETGEKVLTLSAKRGNVVYATRKTKKRDMIKNALDGRVFDFPVPGFRNRRRTKLLLVTVNFDRSKFTPEEAWAALRSTKIEGLRCENNVMNRLNANFRKIFGPHGTLIAKEAQASGYPAPHMILLLDEPVLVQRHVGKDGKVTWRLAEGRTLDRVGKGLLMRKLSRSDYRRAIDMNPIWKHGFMDIEGIVKEEHGKSGRDTVTYAFKYLVKCLTEDGSNSIKGVPNINSVADPKKRTMLYTHLGNKCFRTRDVSFGKGFKDRLGMLPEKKPESPSKWKRVRTVIGYQHDFIVSYRQQVALHRLRDTLVSQEAVT